MAAAINNDLCVIPGSRREQDDNCFLDYYAASGDNNLWTFRVNLWVPSPRVKPIGLETSLRNNHHSLRNNPEMRSGLLRSEW